MAKRSKRLLFSSKVLTSFLFPFPEATLVDGMYFLKHKIHEYSSPAMSMNPKHNQFHLTRAVALPPDLGELATTEFRVLIAHRDRVSRMPTLAGMASYGTRKLTYHVIILMSLAFASQTKEFVINFYIKQCCFP